MMLVEKLFLALLTDDEIKYYAEEDDAGARPVHALLIANTSSALRLFSSLTRRTPARILDSHGKGIFHGENCLHVLCVQQRETEAIEAFQVVSRALPRDDVLAFLTQQADGAFFAINPVDKYGSTPFSYACVSGMKQLVTQIFEWDLRVRRDEEVKEKAAPRVTEGEADAGGAASAASSGGHRKTRTINKNGSKLVGVDVNDYLGFACRRTGFLPLHCLVASKMPKMIDWLLTLPELPELQSYRANVHKRVAVASMMHHADLTPLQLAVWLGDREMVRFLLNRYSKVDWRWGSLTQKRFALTEIDSINQGASNVMELVVHVDAPERTRSMLGVGSKSDFMQGFLFDLFVVKFDHCAKYVFLVFFALDVIYLTLLLMMAFTYRESCGRALAPAAQLLLPVVALQLGSEAFIVAAWLHNHLGARDASRFTSGVWLVDAVEHAFERVQLHRLARMRRIPWGIFFAQIREYHTDWKVLSLVLAAIAISISAYSGSQEGSNRLKQSSIPHLGQGETYVLYIHTKLDAIPSSSEVPFPACSPYWPNPDLISLLLAIAFFSHSYAFIFESLNVIARILGMDGFGRYPRFIVSMMGAVQKWLGVFVTFLLVFSITMYILYPVVPQFRNLFDGVYALLITATTGEPFDGFPPEFPGAYSWTAPWPNTGVLGSPNGIAFIIFYVSWIFFALVLLLNLLIAMMGHEFEHLQLKADLEYRIGFARRVLRAELFATRFLGFCHSTLADPLLRLGQREPGTNDYYYSFVEVGRNAEGLKVLEGEDIFADFSDSEDETEGVGRRPIARARRGTEPEELERKFEKALERALERITDSTKVQRLSPRGALSPSPASPMNISNL